jgi:hypothetical protein
VSRIYQRVIYNPVNYLTPAIQKKIIGRLFPKLRNLNPLAPCYRLINSTTALLDRLLPFWRTGHCVILERTD